MMGQASAQHITPASPPFLPSQGHRSSFSPIILRITTSPSAGLFPSACKPAIILPLFSAQALAHFLSPCPSFIQHSKKGLSTWVLLPSLLVPTPVGLPPTRHANLFSHNDFQLVKPVLYSQHLPAATDRLITPSSSKRFLPGLYVRSLLHP